MRRKREFFSLVVVGLLFIGAGPAFARVLSDDELRQMREADEARMALNEEFADVPGFIGSPGSIGEGGLLTVLVTSEEDKANIPDSYRGFPIEKVVTNDKVHTLTFESYGSVKTEYGIDWIDKPITPLQTGQSTSTKEVKPFGAAVASVSFICLPPIFDTNYVGTLDRVTNNKTLPNPQSIGINSKIADFSMPGTFTIQPGSPNTGMLANDGGLGGTVPKISLPQPFTMPTIILPK